MDPELLKAQAAIAKGADPAAIAALYKSRTGQDLPAPEAPAPASAAPPPGSGVTDFLQSLSQGVTGKWGDELAGLVAKIPGGLTSEEATAASRRASRRAQERHPKLSLLGEGLGMAASTGLAPAALGARAVATGGGLLAPVALGALAGGVEGGLVGAGGAEGGASKRATAAVLPALGGLALGGLLSGAAPLANAAGRRMAGRGGRVAGALRETSGITDDINVTRQRVEDAVVDAQTSGYQVFQGMPNVSQMDLAGGRLSTAIRDKLPKGDVPFLELQTLRNSFRDSGDDASAGLLTNFIEKHYPGFKRADRIYAGAMDTSRTLKAGTEAAPKSGADIEWLTRNQTPAQNETFRTGLVQKSADALTMRDEQAGALIKSLMDQGDAGVRKVRQYFPAGAAGDDAYNAFQQTIMRERSAEAVGRQFKRLVKGAAWIGVGSGVTYGLLGR